jgi:hypothetical protein
MPNLYWVGGTGSANATVGTKWALTSGGAGGQPVPTSSDDVYIDAASGTVTVTLTNTFTCRNLILTGFTGTIAGTQAISIAGGLLLVSGMTYTYTGTITFTATSGINNITTAGKSIGGNWTFNGVGGTWVLQDTVSMVTGKGFTLTNGSLDMTGRTITTGNFVSNNSNVRTLTRTNSTITLTSTGTVWNFGTTTNLTSPSSGSTIIVNDTSATGKTFTGGGLTYDTLTFSGDNITVSGANTITTLNINTAGLTTGLVLTSGVTQTVTNIATNGSLGNLAKLISSSAGSAATISKSSGTVSLDYMSIKDSTATGGASFYAGANSTNVSGNTGWTFTAPPAPGTTTGSFFFTS